MKKSILTLLFLLLPGFTYAQEKLMLKLVSNESIIPYKNYSCHIFTDSLNKNYYILINKALNKSNFTFYESKSFVTVKVVKLTNPEDLSMNVIDYNNIYFMDERGKNQIEVYNNGISYTIDSGEEITIMKEGKIMQDIYLLLEEVKQ